ncbi:MAG: T9SS type A sorting domain-containing protein [Flavisolibacter sp.]
MKKTLLSFFLASIAYLGNLNAQCTILDVTTSDVHKTTSGSNCIVTFNLTITAQLNNGNKGIWVHFWNTANYPATPWNYGNSAPSAAFLSSSIGTLGVDNSGATPIVLSSYPFSTSQPVVMATAGTPQVTTTGSGSGTVYSYVFTNVTLNLANNDCTIPAIKADVWSTNANSLGSNTKPQCTFTGRSLNIGDLSLNLTPPVKACKGSLAGTSLSFLISTNSATPITVTYEIHKDDNNLVNNEFVYESTPDINVTTGGSKTATISSGNSFSAVNFTDFTGANAPGNDANYWVVVKYTPANGTPYNIANIAQNECASVLPVNFKSFTASKSGSTNGLRWTTSTEINNKGFYVQRFYNGQWENLGFIATKADGGNSTSDLNYVFNDVFNFKGVVQYRILQVDIDGKAKYSQVRSLSNEGNGAASSILIYPNPASAHGNVSLVLSDASAFYDLQIIDNSGRIVKEFNAVRSTQQVSGLPKGQYLARAKERESGQVSVEKFIVQ